jgi:hypothetical protein
MAYNLTVYINTLPTYTVSLLSAETPRATNLDLYNRRLKPKVQIQT